MLAIAAEFHPESNRNTASNFFCSRNDALRNVIRVPANSTLHVKMQDNTVRYVLLGNTTVIVDPWGSNFQTFLHAQVDCTVTVTSFASSTVNTIFVLDSPTCNTIKNPVNVPVIMPAGGILQINVSDQVMNVVGNGSIANATASVLQEVKLDLANGNKIVPINLTDYTTATIDLTDIANIDECVRDWIVVVTGARAEGTRVSFLYSGPATLNCAVESDSSPSNVVVSNPSLNTIIVVNAGTHIFVTKILNRLFIRAAVLSVNSL